MGGVQLLAGERQKGERDRAVIACNDYLLMGPGRSLRKLWEQYREQKRLQTAYKPPTVRLKTLSDWSVRYDWQTRAKLYDAEQERIKAEKFQAEIEAMLGRQARNAQALQTAGAQLVFALLDRTRRLPDELKEMTVRQLAKLLPQAARAIEVGGREERQARGLPGERKDITSADKPLFTEAVMELPPEEDEGSTEPEESMVD